MKKMRVLHLSDIHIGDTYIESESIAYRIISDIENDNLNNIQCVVVTGDIFEGSKGYSKDLIYEAVKFFNIIFDQLSMTNPLQKSDFLFVPGNHDVIRTNNMEERWLKYKSFLQGFYGEIPDFYDKEDYTLLKLYSEYNVAFIGFNSVGLEETTFLEGELNKLKEISDEDIAKINLKKTDFLKFIDNQLGKKVVKDYGEISPKQILNINRKLKQYDDYNIIAMFHHHFYLFPEVHKKHGDSSLIRNYTNVIQQLQQMGVRAVFHGHKHFDLERPLIDESYYENPDNTINIIAGGSVSTSRTLKHSFNIIDLFDKENNYKMVLKKFVYNDDKPEHIITKYFPPEHIENNNIIKILKLFEINSPELYNLYSDAIEKINIASDDYNHLIKWFENVFAGFSEILKIFQSYPECIFILLFCMNYRVLCVKRQVGKQDVDESYFKILDDLFNNYNNDKINKDLYIQMLKCDDLNDLKKHADSILHTLQNKISKYYLSFAMTAIFFTDMYLMLRYYAGSFYNKFIKYKVNIILDENEFHQNIPVNKIMIHSDLDRRSAVIDLKCNSATSHKLAVLFVKQFELLINKFEDYFKIIGLKLYYISPRIEKNENINTIDNYNFEAFIPTLIPLLTGDNIYSKKEVFARELIQNSIDAIAVRESKSIENLDFDKSIYITLSEENGRKIFRIRDYGTGMDRFKIERYFTSIGRSFYSGDEYHELEIDYKPISNFGIGFLSAFMVCREIDVKTKYFIEENEGIQLHIPNYDGCFFIEKNKNIDIGTEITLYIDDKISKNIMFDSIIRYIYDTMQDIKYNVFINDKFNDHQILIEAHKAKKDLNNHNIIFIPFLEDGTILNINVRDEIWSGKFKIDYPYGLLINLYQKGNFSEGVLNSGIKLYETSIKDIWSIISESNHRISAPHNMFLFNFPSNFIDIDVSREKINSLTRFVDIKAFNLNIISEIFNQVLQYFDLAKNDTLNITAYQINSLMLYIAALCNNSEDYKQLKSKIMNERYVLFISHNNETIDLIISHNNNKPENSIMYSKNNMSKYKDEIMAFMHTNNIQFKGYNYIQNIEKIYYIFREFHHIDDYNDYYVYSHKTNMYIKYLDDYEEDDNIEKKMLQFTKIKKPNWCYGLLILLQACLFENNEQRPVNLIYIIFISLLQRYNISDIENGRAVLSVSKTDIEQILKMNV